MLDAATGPEAQRDRLLQGLREHGTVFGELGRQFGARMGLHTTDGHALVEILSAQDRGAPLTQAELGHRVGLTPGATSALLNRLEAAGHVTRSRDSVDRRVVTLRSTDGVEAMVGRFFGPLADRMGAMMSTYPPELLAEFERFLAEVCATMDAYVAESANR
ncbi:MarR family winged helix-turn-helix transcriptional regulator [Catenuloplanes sp. NPDC051500]|uniref:MarR family winged helix-turn-helix transcriptional regulator n=1 Tax=Catenuloplanes sp. NPDC051500 TaxID=3363959 RepID=UPI0037BD21D5